MDAITFSSHSSIPSDGSAQDVGSMAPLANPPALRLHRASLTYRTSPPTVPWISIALYSPLTCRGLVELLLHLFGNRVPTILAVQCCPRDPVMMDSLVHLNISQSHTVHPAIASVLKKW